MTVTEQGREIGAARRRKEDRRLITGQTRWTDNITLPGMLHAAMVRSPFAHARITSIDTEQAKDAANVVAVLTGADVADDQGTMITAWPITPEQNTPNHPPIAVDEVAFAGEVVAVVVARSAAEARDAAEHFWPWNSKAPRVRAVRRMSTSAEGWAMTKSLPPVSPINRG